VEGLPPFSPASMNRIGGSAKSRSAIVIVGLVEWAAAVDFDLMLVRVG
jgi:hypothetical protein